MTSKTNSNATFEALVGEIAKSCKTQEDLTNLFKQLKHGELTEHLGYDKHARQAERRITVVFK